MGNRTTEEIAKAKERAITEILDEALIIDKELYVIDEDVSFICRQNNLNEDAIREIIGVPKDILLKYEQRDK